MVERREPTSTGEDTTHSFADDNVLRGEPGVDFIKRRPTYPLGDDPRGREINFEAGPEDTDAYGSTRSLVFRAYRGQAPLEGQRYDAPSRVGQLPSANDLRPELPNKSVDIAALDAAKALERERLLSSDFRALFPYVSINTPAPGSTATPGSRLEVRATVSAIRFITSAVLFVDGQAVDRRTIDRRDQEATSEYQFIFLYDIPANRNLGPMDLTVRGFNMNSSSQAFIADDAKNEPPQADQIDLAVGTLDGRLGQSHGSQTRPPLLDQTYILRTPEGVASISINIV